MDRILSVARKDAGNVLTAEAQASAVQGLLERAEEHLKRGEGAEAKDLSLQALQANPRNAWALSLLGQGLSLMGEVGVAMRMLERAVAAEPEECRHHALLGMMQMHQKMWAAAEAELCRAIECDDSFLPAWEMLGELFLQRGQGEAVERCCAELLQRAPRNLAAQLLLVRLRMAEERLEEAGRLLRDLTSLYPAEARVLVVQGDLEQRLRHLDEARRCYLQAWELAHEDRLLYKLGGVERESGAFGKSVAYFRKFLERDRQSADGYNSLGQALCNLGEFDEATECFERALSIAPEFGEAALNRALIQLLQEDFAAGWKNYQCRKTHPGYIRHRVDLPRWQGEVMAERPLLLLGEQGIGDEIMFAGLIHDLLARVPHLAVVCEARLHALLSRSWPGIRFVDAADLPRLSAAGAYECHAYMGDLAEYLRPDVASFARASSPYLRADEGLRQRFVRRKEGQPLRIGLAWHTSNQVDGYLRSLQLEQLAGMMHLPGTEWVSLQYGDFAGLEEQVMRAGVQLEVDRTVDQLKDMESFAAQISTLDLVISIDNSTAHLAGALGIPTWLLLPVFPDWRWFLNREESLWYRSVRIFRQKEQGVWAPVLQQVRHCLEEKL